MHRGLMREAEAKALRTLERLRQGFSGEDDANGDGEDDDHPKAASMSDRLAQCLSAHRTAALQIELARHPQAALAAVALAELQRAASEALPQDSAELFRPPSYFVVAQAALH